MKKAMALILALLMVVSLAACGEKDSGDGVKEFTAFFAVPGCTLAWRAA